MNTWKDIPGWEGLYQICRSGKVRNKRTKHILAVRTHKDGYLKVHLSDRGNGRDCYLRVHRLVAETFIPNPENKSEVEHKNGRTSDNRISNLMWVTRSENMLLCFERRRNDSI